MSRRVPVNGQIGERMKGWKVAIDKFPDDDPDPDRRLVLETIRWMFARFAEGRVSFRSIAQELEAKAFPAPAGGRHARHGA